MRADLEILACAMACCEAVATADEVVLATADNSLSALARIHGVATVTLEEMRAELEVRDAVYRKAYATELGSNAVAAATGLAAADR